MEKAVFKRTGPLHRIFQGGVCQINTKFDGYLLLGTNDGSVAKIDKTTMKVVDEVILCDSGVKAVASSEMKIYGLTGKGVLYSSIAEDPLNTMTVFMSSQCQNISEIIFPRGFSEVFATRSSDEISIWNVTD